jgi:hypothetical protein
MHEDADMPLPEPPTDFSLVVRADFADDSAWRRVVELLEQPVEGFAAGLHFVDDPAYRDVTPSSLLDHASGQDLSFAFLADAETMAGTEHTLVVVDLFDEPGRSFRVIPAEVAPVQNNLEIANMDFHEFADSVDPDGVFRGFAADP